MSFHLSQTPTLEAVSTDDEKLLAHDLLARVDAAAQQARAQAVVASALDAQHAAEERFSKLRSAERTLNQQVRSARERMDQISRSVLDAMIESASDESKFELKKLAELASIEDRVRYMGRAIERLAEHLIPLASIASLREEAHALMAEARAIEQMAQERAEKILGQIREAVSDEMVLPVDLSKGVAGALIARSKALKTRAVQVSETADRLEKSYQKRNEAA
jgi:hypothetical protein